MLDWNTIDTVLLDMDGTLLDLHFDSHFWLEHLPRRYCELHRLDEALQADLKARIISESGTLNWYSLDYWSRELKLDVVALKREVQHLIGYRHEAEDFLAWLRDQPQRVVLATNADRHGIDLKFALTGMGDYFDAVVSSADLGHAKEEQAFWHKLNEIEPFDPARTLFIDDNPQVLESAHTYGIAHLLGVRQPDSKRPARDFERVHGLDGFAVLTEGAGPEVANAGVSSDGEGKEAS
ncbi:GMP/IMP nucleotidase [Cobetia sp. 4B]|uniref:GMP/IMP nucleotidase n=1 Tax=Cobetia sp. 4B TaxID=2758724 RepID=UPI001C03FC17|nr:GMP/IMP nucleotidase [Cobetia sp. 4B]MBR9755436.1 GMP/IMP nucleotidase [Gammaproteobacteria bacterium]QWN36202.1 GMP/IMP nucleotidase [Cobetia sp. 4B]